jgi:heme/copper-type cytochrome/quinol oxidase subunit 3
VHFGLIVGRYKQVYYGFITTLFLAVIFTLLQIGEYLNAPFNITDSVYGSSFFSLTGLHGLHVIIGSIFIFICFIRFLNFHFTTKHHLGFEFAS